MPNRRHWGLGECTMKTEMNMIYWKAGKFWLGKLKEHPEIMTQGRTLKELEENIRDAYVMMVMDDVPEQHREKAIAI
jgi:predicted RNase H-like HicB family nuclease